jgi:hypothetical protein
MYTLNGKYSNQGIAEQYLDEGDVIIFHYTDDYSLEDGTEWLGGEEEEPAPITTQVVTVTETITTDSGNAAAAVVDAGAVENAVKNAAKDKEQAPGGVVEILVEISGTSSEAVSAVYVALPAKAVEYLINGVVIDDSNSVPGVDKVKITSELGGISLDRAALSAVAAKAGERGLNFVLAGVTPDVAQENLKLPKAEAIRVYEISLYGVSPDTQITDFGAGTLQIALPYELPEDKTITVWRARTGAEAETVDGAAYDPVGRRAVFTANHLSYYAVGYVSTAEEPNEPNEPNEPTVPARRPSPNGGQVTTAPATVTAPQTAAPVTVSKASLSYISGADRVLTSVAIAKEGWTSAESVILAPGGANNLIDALAVAPLAGREGAPILLSVGGLDPAVVAEIQRLGAKKIYAVGALSQSVIDALRTALPNVTVDVLKGGTRQETAALVGAKVTNPQGTFIVGYNAVADAVSVASYAAANGYLIQIAAPDGSVSAAPGGEVYILGGPALVKDAAGATRLYGPDRYATNKAVRDALSFEYTNIYTADGNTLVDALTGSALAAQTKAAIVLAPGNDPTGVDFGGITPETKIYAFGGR